jgi:hypothetical protein
VKLKLWLTLPVTIVEMGCGLKQMLKTGLFWNHMASFIFISIKEKASPGVDCLMFC